MKLVNTAAAFLMGVAQEAITMRAKRDVNGPHVYDTKRDPEGYITSLLTALRHWCHRYGISWDVELSRAEDFFRSDLGDSTGDGKSDIRPKIQNMQCPECKHRGSFKIQVQEYLLIFHDYLELDRSQKEQWNGGSKCVCPSCGFHGVVIQFQADVRKDSCHG